MPELSLLSRISLYALLTSYGLFALLLWVVQCRVLRGETFENPDGSKDDWHEQKAFYGIAFADVFVACPAHFVGIALLFFCPRWGYYLLALVSFWWVWANVMTTATSLRFYEPRRNLTLWLAGYPLGIFLGLAYIAWTVIHFDIIYFPS